MELINSPYFRIVILIFFIFVFEHFFIHFFFRNRFLNLIFLNAFYTFYHCLYMNSKLKYLISSVLKERSFNKIFIPYLFVIYFSICIEFKFNHKFLLYFVKILLFISILKYSIKLIFLSRIKS